MSTKLVSNENRVITVGSPEGKDVIIPTDNQLADVFEKVLSSNIVPYVDAVSNDPLISSLDEPGEIISETIHEDININRREMINSYGPYFQKWEKGVEIILLVNRIYCQGNH